MIDLAIIGGGPAGLTAAVYAARGGVKSVTVYEGDSLGGQIIKSSEIENYPGQYDVVDGFTLMQSWPKQAEKFGTVIESKRVVSISKDGDNFRIKFESGDDEIAKAVIVATGSRPKKAGFKNEDKFLGQGVSTCATCDGFFYKGQDVAVIGGGETALEETVFLSNIANKIYLVHRSDTFNASQNMIDRAMKLKNVEYIYNSSADEVIGDNSGVKGLNIVTPDGARSLNVTGIFVFVGRDINNTLLKDGDSYICDVSDYGEVIVDFNMKTNIPGLFVAGDLRVDSPKQVVCAAGDGAIAGMQARSYIQHNS